MLQRSDLLRRQDRAGAGYRSGIRLRDHSRTGSGTWQDRIAAGTGSGIALGQVLGRGRVALGQDRSEIRLQDRSGTGFGTWQDRSGAGSQRDQAPGSLRWQDLLRWQDRIASPNAPGCGTETFI